jgi:hypothetical protein
VGEPWNQKAPKGFGVPVIILMYYGKMVDKVLMSHRLQNKIQIPRKL